MIKLPDDGKRKKAVVRQTLSMLIDRCGGFEQIKAAVLYALIQSDGYMNKLCTRTLYELDGSPHVRVDEYMKHRLQNKLIWAILKDSL